MGMKYLLDTNAVLDFMGNRFPVTAHTIMSKIIDEEINLSIINKIELLGFTKVEQDLIDFVDCANVLPLSDEVANKTIEIRRACKIKLPDAIIAATALAHNLVLVSHNTKDFQKIPHFRFFNPYQD
jgi:predicted nucleic acid-binding protein